MSGNDVAVSSVTASLSWHDRLEIYAKQTGFPRCLSIGDDGRAAGMWIT